MKARVKTARHRNRGLAAAAFSPHCTKWNDFLLFALSSLRRAFVERDMRTIGAALLTLSLASAGIAIATTTANAAPAVAIRVGNVGIGVGHYHYHNHWYHHRRWAHGGYRYW
jgi:hypothetical protein